jgi:hypothetical protein
VRRFALIVLAAAAADAGPIDDRLTASDPCEDLPGLSETESVALDRATITLLPETGSLSLSGRIACRTPDDALLRGDASVRVEAEVTVALSGCTATASDVRLTDHSGSLAGVVEALAPELERMLAEDVAGAAEDACRDLLDGVSDP